MALALSAIGAVTAIAAGPAINGWLDARPLTPQEIKDYALTGATTASGLKTIAVSQAAYLDALVNPSLQLSNITGIVWTVTTKPVGANPVLTNSPLGTNVPIHKPSDRSTYKVAERKLFRPDLAGQYVVSAAISTTDSGSTNVSIKITAGTYLGAATCALCHSGGLFADNIYEPYSQTLHARAFSEAIDGLSTDHFSKNCISCHALGFDSNTNSANGGFDDVAAQNGWVFPTVLTNGNWAAMPSALKAVANVQCENCHGPGSEHAYAFGNTNVVNWPRVSVTYAPGNCAQCHDSLTHHYKTAEWSNSRHAVATRTPSGPTRFNCVRCHTAAGFAQFIDHASSTNSYVTNTVYEAITCAACHDPHDASNPHQLRAANTYTLPEGTTVTNVGNGALCMTCHHSRNGSATNNIAKFQLNQPTWAGGASFGVHDSTAGDMVEGVNGITYGKVIPSGSHSTSIPDVCVGCHMQPVAATDPAFLKAGGHTFSMTYPMVSGGVTNTLDKVDVCEKCHGPMEDFNLVRKDYDGDGVIEGIQTEVQHLLDRLSKMLPNSTYRADGNYVADGLAKSSVSAKTNWPVRFLNAAWNWQFVNVEGSKGIHNAPYAVGLLKASIADLTGDSNNDGIPDSWQNLYFGSTTSASASPYASPAGDGIPNWVKFNLGLNPLFALNATNTPSGVVWVNGKNMINSTNNTIAIFTAAEVAFDTGVGTNYQIQGISTLNGGWQNIGAAIPGTGSTVSYLTPTRTNTMQFFRVMHTP
ncbi:MAG: cytochrome c3 family protein [Verrucomicrobiota bacterium]